MNPQMKIIENSFYQLIIIYTAIIVLITLGFLGKYSLYFNILALVIAIFGISIISKEEETKPINKTINIALIFLSIILILTFRIMPYINNSIPIGYDAGIYKYSIEQFKEKAFGVENWILGSMSPLFLYVTFILSLAFSSQAILTWLFILSCLILGIMVYFATREYFGRETALITILIYSASVIQLKVFEFLYYKNILALSLMLASLIFLKRENRVLFVIFSALTGAMHLPTFYIFGLAYIFYSFISPINNKKYNLQKLKLNILLGTAILILTSIFYIGFYKQAVLPLIFPALSSFIEPGTASGTFLSFFQYQFSTLAYLPFAILGFFIISRRKQFNMLFFLALTAGIIVYFQFFFFNRFIIHLDIFLIMLAGLGFSEIIREKKKLGTAILVILLLSSAVLAYQESKSIKPAINSEQLELIQQISNTEYNSIAISVSSEYSPYVLAYSGRETIAPGLFGNNWTREEWQEFWNGNVSKTKELLSLKKPVYLFAGAREFDNLCFELFLKEGDNKIYRYEC